MDKTFTVKRLETVYNGFFRLEKYQLQHQLFRGGTSRTITRELFMRGSCVAVILFDPTRREVVLIEQFRPGAMFKSKNAWLIEIVAGAIENGENAEQVAHREALEEAGCHIQKLLPISNFYTTPGGCCEKINLFCGIVDSSKAGNICGLKSEDEDILVLPTKLADAYNWIASGKIESAISIIAIQWLYINQKMVSNA